MKGEERSEGGADDFERRLRAALDGRSDRVDPSPYAYRSVLRRAERARRTRVRRRLAVAGAAAVVVGAVPVGVALVADEPTEVVSSAQPEGLPRLQPGEVPSGFELTEVVDLAPDDTTLGAEDFVQVLEPVGRDGRIVARQSSLSPNQLVPPVDATQVDVNGSAAWLARIDLDRASLTWADNQTQVVRELYARGFSDAELVDVAESLRRRLDGPGFDIDALPVGLVAVDEGGMFTDEDPAPISWTLSEVDPDRNGAIELTVRDGSPLELEMLRVTAPRAPLVVPGGGIDRLLFSDSDDGDVHRLVWNDGDAIVEMTGEGLTPAELLDVAANLEAAGPDDWERFLAAAPAGGVFRTVDEPAAELAEEDLTDEPGFAVEGLIDGTPWRLSRPAALDVGACLTLQLGTPSGAHCLPDLDATAVAFDLGDVTALVVVAPGDQVRSVDLGAPVAPYVIDGVWIAWPATDTVPEFVAVDLMGAGPIELPVGLPNDGDDAEPADEPDTDDGGAQ